jgi:hypothetical protein
LDIRQHAPAHQVFNGQSLLHAVRVGELVQPALPLLARILLHVGNRLRGSGYELFLSLDDRDSKPVGIDRLKVETPDLAIRPPVEPGDLAALKIQVA